MNRRKKKGKNSCQQSNCRIYLLTSCLVAVLDFKHIPSLKFKIEIQQMLTYTLNFIYTDI